jgi:H+/Cl- antiporter ClcA
MHIEVKTYQTNMQQTGKIIIGIGLLLVVVGIVVYLAGDKLNWLGRLPGDIRVEKENFRLYFPITTMILISVVISVLVRFFQKFF